MKKFISSLCLITMVSSPSFAAAESKKGNTGLKPVKTENHSHKDHHDKMDHKEHKHDNSEAEVTSNKDGEVLIKVKGMVCAFCAQGIKKNFNAREEVENTNVDLDKMEVNIKLKKGKTLSEKVISEIVTGAGFKFVGIQ